MNQGNLIAGKKLSYRNCIDANIAYSAIQELLYFKIPHGVAVIKHGNLCGYACGVSPKKSFNLAWEGNRKSNYGSVIAFSFPLTEELTEDLKNKYIDILIAPSYDPSFLNWIQQWKPRVKLLEIPIKKNNTLKTHSKKTRLSSTKTPQSDLYSFSISTVNAAMTNAVAITREPEEGYYQLIGIGAGKPYPMDSLRRLAIPKAIENLQQEHGFNPEYEPKQDLANCIIASDVMFSQNEILRYAAKSGIKTCIFPRESQQQRELIETANKLSVNLIYTETH